MKYLKPYAHTLSLSIWISIILLLLVATAIAQPQKTDGPQKTDSKEQRARSLRVGTTAAEVKAGKKVDLWAIIVGVSRYKNGDENLDGYQISNLKNAADDAQALYDFLRSDEGGNFRDVNEGGHMILLKDEQGTKENLTRALSMLKQAKPDDYFVVYIAMHGALIPQRTNDNRTIDIPYFVLYDSDLRDMAKTGFQMEEFRNLINKIPARKGLVLSDTCHSAGVQMAGRDPSSTSIRANTRYLEEMERIGGGVGFISASQQLEQSYELDEFGHGAFTQTLLDALRGNADNDQNGIVTFNELVQYIRDEVPQYTDNKQHPYYNTTSIEANYLPLSVVNYADTSYSGDYGTLVLKAPDLDNVKISVDGEDVGVISSNQEKSIKVKSGMRTLLFTRGIFQKSLSETVEKGRSKLIEVNLSFSESDDDALVAPTDKQANIYLREDREPTKEAKNLFLKGVDLFNKQKFEDAIKQFKQAIEVNSGAYADAYIYRGRAEQSLDHDEAAISSFNAALAARPSDYETRTLLAEAQFSAGYNVNDIVNELQQIIKNHTNFDYARVVLGDILLWRKDMIGAERQLRRAIQINPLSPPAHMILADILTYQKSPAKQQEAIKEAETALKLFQDVSRKQVSFGSGIKKLSLTHLIFNSGRYINNAVMAESSYILAKTINRAVERNETITDRDNMLNRARSNIQTAMDYAQKANDRRRTIMVLELSAENYLLKGDVTHAIEHGEKALNLSANLPDMKDYPDAHYTLYTAYNSKQQFKKAAEHLSKFIEVYGKQISTQEKNSLDEELKRLKRAAEINR